MFGTDLKWLTIDFNYLFPIWPKIRFNLTITLIKTCLIKKKEPQINTWWYFQAWKKENDITAIFFLLQLLKNFDFDLFEV